MFKYATAELPKADNRDVRINNLRGTRNEDVINKSVDQHSHRLVLTESAERSHYFERPEKNPVVPRHPLDRYSHGGYYDPCWESIEEDRLAFHASVPSSIISDLKNKAKYNVAIDALSNEDMYKLHAERDVGKNDRTGIHAFKLNDTVGDSFDRTFNGLHEEKRYAINDTHGTGSASFAHKLNDPCASECVPIAQRFYRCPPHYESNDPVFHFSSDNVYRPIHIESSGYNTVDLGDIPLYPEVKPYVQREYVDGLRKTKARQPAGKSFSSVETQHRVENFKLCDPEHKADLCVSLTDKEYADIDKFLNKRDNEVKKEGFDTGDKTGNSGFENSIAREADYMYMSALKVRANAVCEYLSNNKAYDNWKDNWKLLKGNLRNGRLFERLSESDADIAYVINKGDQVKFRIRDKSRYVPINTYQYVLYHEMAHMSTRELQHTPGFMKLLNIISLAGFECGFLDFRKLPNDYYITNGSPILCRDSMKEEVCLGAKWLKEANPKSAKYYDGIIAAVKRA